MRGHLPAVGRNQVLVFNTPVNKLIWTFHFYFILGGKGLIAILLVGVLGKRRSPDGSITQEGECWLRNVP